LLAVLLVSLADTAASQSAFPTPYAPALVEVGGASRRRLWLLGVGTVALFGLFGAGWSRSPGVGGWSAVADGARSLLGYGTLTMLVATVVGFALGAAAASGPNAADGLLIRIFEVGGGLPAVLWAAALSRALGSGATLALCLGLLRAVDVAWLLRSELLRRASANQELSARSLGHLPLSIYVRQRLRPAALPALSAVALTPAWLVGIAVAGRLASLPASAGAPGWSLLLSQPLGADTLPCIAAALMLSLLTWLLLSIVTSPPRRVGAARVSQPPADGIDL
jgi:ABC-type dipeptide/oligopeptide/nickel transport system permease subunit